MIRAYEVVCLLRSGLSPARLAGRTGQCNAGRRRDKGEQARYKHDMSTSESWGEEGDFPKISARGLRHCVEFGGFISMEREEKKETRARASKKGLTMRDAELAICERAAKSLGFS